MIATLVMTGVIVFGCTYAIWHSYKLVEKAAKQSRRMSFETAMSISIFSFCAAAAAIFTLVTLGFAWWRGEL